MYEIRVLEGEEKNITRELWEKVFEEDSISFLDYYYKYKCRDNLVYVIEHAGKVISMLQRNPYAMKVNDIEVTADYIVGVATDKDFRHQGLMARLLKTALNDMADKSRPFTFLMPAAEAIYTPFGFRFVYAQSVYKETTNSNDDMHTDEISAKGREETGRGAIEGNDNISDKFVVVPMTDALVDCFSKQINSHLEKNYDVFTLRTEEYFEDLSEMYKSDGGKVCCILSEDKLVAYFSWWLTDKGAEITELICFDNDRETVIAYIKEYFRKTYQTDKFVIRGEVPDGCDYENRIMLRITNVSSMLRFIRSDKDLRIKLSVKDKLIPQNNKVFLWDVSEEESYVSVIEEEDSVLGREADSEYNLKVALYDKESCLKAASYDTEAFDYELIIDIEELALWLFKGMLPENNSDLECIRPLSKVFINEIV